MADTERTRVFISWSGDRSLKVANSLQAWLKMVVQPIDVWFSDVNITPGLRWRHALGDELQKSQFAIVCLTRENMNAPWLLFEAGAIGRSLDESRVVPLLLDLSQSDVKGPLAEFQALPLDQIGIWRLVRELHAISDSGVDASQQKRIFDALWPMLKTDIEAVADPHATNDALDSSASTTTAALAEILDQVRSLRVAPDENAVLTALDGLFIQAQGELHYLTDQAQRTSPGDGSAMSDALRSVEARIMRIRSATDAMRGGLGRGLSAADVRINGFADLARAARLLMEDLEHREYSIETRGGFNSPLHTAIGQEMVNLGRILATIDELDSAD